MLYNTPNSSQSLGAGFDMGVHYTHFFSSLGFGFGMHYSTVNAYALYDGAEVTDGLTHADNPYAHYNLTTRFDGWKECQHMVVLSLPFEAFFRAHMGGGRFFICGAGVQVDLPLRGSYSAAAGSYTTSGVFPALGAYELSDLPEHGFSTYSDTYGAKIENLKVGFSVVADLGMRLPLGTGGGLYVGIYGGYGLTDILGDQQGAPLLTINTSDASRIDYHGTFSNGDISAVNLLRVGLKVGVDLGSPMDN